jgi:Fe-S-cluster containining protein
LGLIVWKRERGKVKNHNHPNGTSESECIRCGTCCEKGGPAFHQEDRRLIEKGRIPSRYLFTIRKGEFAYDNVKACLAPVESDIIKIKGKEDTWTCIFLDEENKQCSIYHNRPLECRALKCWDTRELEKMYTRQRLTREDLISKIEGLWDLVKDHQERCDYEKINKLINDLDGPDPDSARRELLIIIQFDAEIRKLVLEKGGLASEMLDFVFGRSLKETLPNYGVTIRRDGTKTIITRSTRPRHY